MNDVPEVIRSGFAIEGEVSSARPFGEGRIHESWVSTWTGGRSALRYLHQKLNEHVLFDLDAVMGNLVRVVDHVKKKRPFGRHLTLVPGRDGAPLVRDENGAAWRTFEFVEGTRSYARVRSPDHAREAGRAYGRLVADLKDLPPPRLAVSIPRFHDTPSYLAALPGDAPEIDRFRRLSYGAGAVVDGLRTGALPERICHHDTKLDNVLIDEETGRAACVVDLDTVMPGSLVTDFGDLVRSATNPGSEEGDGEGAIDPDPDVFTAVTEGFLTALGDLPTAAELALLPSAGRLVSLELAARFLADHLAGDCYFRVRRRGDNLTRARTQLALAEGFARSEPMLERIVKAAAERLDRPCRTGFDDLDPHEEAVGRR